MRGMPLLVLVVLLTACSSDRIARLERQKELTAKLESISDSVPLDLQERCANQARKAFKDQGPWGKNVLATFTNHYNQHLKKCFIEIHASNPGKGGIFASTFISDAFEGKDYGQYSATVAFPEAPPTICHVTSLSGEEKSCRSAEEFRTAIKPYME